MDLEKTIAEQVGVAPEETLQAVEQPNTGNKGGESLLSFLRAKTGDGRVNDYVESPLNFDRSEELGQVLRGLTGLLGSLDYAIVDILFGLFRWFKKRGVAGGKSWPTPSA